MITAYIGLGANLDDPPGQIREAIEGLRKQPDIVVSAISDLYRSAPLGPPGQGDYCNAVIQVETRLSARQLLEHMLAIEKGMGRRRGGVRWGPRRIDLDLLLFGQLAIDEAGLRVPHAEMHRRNFVLIPLAEIAPQVEIPGYGSAQSLAEHIGRQDLKPWVIN